MVDLNAHEAGNGGKKPREAYSSPSLLYSEAARLGRTAMSSKELRRAGVLARVESGELKLVDAAVLMGMSYRQSKRLAKRYREGERKG
jgi:hypothetical protein